MFYITGQSQKLHKAIATSVLRLSALETLDDIEQSGLSLQTLFEGARLAGLRAAKNTSAFVPHFHPVPVTYTAIDFEIKGFDIIIEAAVHALARTGVTLQAMHTATVAALHLYAILHPFDTGIEIGTTRIVSATEYDPALHWPRNPIRAAVVVCSNAVAMGVKEDKAGRSILAKLKDFSISCDAYAVITDDVDAIQQKAKSFADQGFQLLIFCGGTGMLQSDKTPDAIAPLLQRQMPAIMEAARAYGQERTPFALFSRGVAGFISDTLVLTLPGSSRGAAETIDALFPEVLALFSEENLARR
ncbi:cyclic pyranopterin monophosphate synthase MoaC [Pseudocnuella soli]|uniref:cyclic pyranopterin monophosphate synthase MoaC n=1 Tax=Pseudocnuella soli TaxID=2502779 RepID=UPI001042CFB9|nr:cyclic pyranopterin monophosphate synthase MoaC [Pseudocnuella soli]